MSTRWPTHCLCAALLVFGMVTLSTGKPPDLPAASKVDCKDNPEVPEYGSSTVPAGAVELEEVVPADVIESAPIDTLCPWLDALIRACEDRVEVWFDDSTKGGLRATSSHTVQIIDGDDMPPAKFIAPNVVVPMHQPCMKVKGVICPVGFSQPCHETSDPVCRTVRACCAHINHGVAICVNQCKGRAKHGCAVPAKLGQVIILGGCEVKPEHCAQSADPVCRSVRACCGHVNVAAAKCANHVKACLKTKEVKQGPNVMIYTVSFVTEKAPKVAANCPVCRSFRACCGHVHWAVTICVKDVHSCVKPCDKCDGSEECEPCDPCEECEPVDEPKSDSTSPCPWMRETKKAKTTPQSAVPVIPATPLENLKKLEQARALLKDAEKCRHTGKVEKARMLYAKVRALVPGSRLDAVAEKQIENMGTAKIQDKIQDFSGPSQATVVIEEAEYPKDKAAEPAPAKSDCPFILMKQKKVVVVPVSSNGFPNALDNLKKLEQAQEMLENAENCLKEGMLDQAMALFRQVHLVCPGSPVDRRASQQGEALNAKLGEARMLLADALRLVLTQNYDQACDLYTKLEELLPNSIYAQIASEHRSMIQYIGAAFKPGQEEASESKPCCVEEQVAELLEECQRAIADGAYDKAATLAKKAQKLDKDCVAANALVYKAQMLLQLREKQKDLAKRSKKAACVPLCPHMPAIDPCVVRDIERAIQVREEAIARQRQKKEAGQTEEAEPKPPVQKDVEEDGDSPQARANEAGKALTGLLGIVHAGTGVEIALAMDRVRFEYHHLAALKGVAAAMDSIQKAVAPGVDRP